MHRDFKLDNILVSRDFILKIADFGLSRILDQGNESDLSQCGAPSIRAPES